MGTSIQYMITICFLLTAMGIAKPASAQDFGGLNIDQSAIDEYLSNLPIRDLYSNSPEIVEYYDHIERIERFLGDSRTAQRLIKYSGANDKVTIDDAYDYFRTAEAAYEDAVEMWAEFSNRVIVIAEADRMTDALENISVKLERARKDMEEIDQILESRARLECPYCTPVGLDHQELYQMSLYLIQIGESVINGNVTHPYSSGLVGGFVLDFAGGRIYFPANDRE